MSIPAYLYRGVNPEMHKASSGRLIPRPPGKEFKQPIYYGSTGDPEKDSYYRDGSTYGASEANAVIKHQRNSSKNPTSGISTTPVLENAKRYATHDGKYPNGFVYKIDTALLSEHSVTAHEVAAHATRPAIPGDKEIILVAEDYGALPAEIVVEVMDV
jgi:hypothetical protein